MRYRVIRDGETINHVEWDRTTGWQPPEGCTLEPIEDEPETEPDPEALEATRLMHEAMALLKDRDYVTSKSTEKKRILSADWVAWRDSLRTIVNTRSGVIEPEPERYDIAAEREAEFQRHVIEWAKGQYLALFEAEPEAPLSPTPDPHKFPAPDERLSDWDMVGVSDTERGVLKTAMEDGESVSAAKRRLYPILNEELSRLQNQEALLGASTPESVSARRKEVESLLGILARVGDA